MVKSKSVERPVTAIGLGRRPSEVAVPTKARSRTPTATRRASSAGPPRTRSSVTRWTVESAQTSVVRCVPEGDAEFANCVRAVATYFRLVPRYGRRGPHAWEAPLRRAFGYAQAEARVESLIGGASTVTIFRDGAPAHVTRRRRHPVRGPVA